MWTPNHLSSMYFQGSFRYRCIVYMMICIWFLLWYISCEYIMLLPLQLYFEKIKELILRRSDSVLFKEALVSLATDSGIHPLVPYFMYFIADEVNLGPISWILRLTDILVEMAFYFSHPPDVLSPVISGYTEFE